MRNQNYDLVEKVGAALTGLIELPDESKREIIEVFCRVRPPEILEGDRLIRMIVLESDGRNGGFSLKPGNITLNWKRLISAIPGIIITVASASASPWIVVFSALVVWRDIYSSIKVELSPQHAIALYVMWQNHDEKRKISEAIARDMTNKNLKNADLNELSLLGFARIIDDLNKIGCIEVEDGQIWLRERISRRWP